MERQQCPASKPCPGDAQISVGVCVTMAGAPTRFCAKLCTCKWSASTSTALLGLTVIIWTGHQNYEWAMFWPLDWAPRDPRAHLQLEWKTAAAVAEGAHGTRFSLANACADTQSQALTQSGDSTGDGWSLWLKHQTIGNDSFFVPWWRMRLYIFFSLPLVFSTPLQADVPGWGWAKLCPGSTGALGLSGTTRDRSCILHSPGCRKTCPLHWGCFTVRYIFIFWDQILYLLTLLHFPMTY